MRPTTISVGRPARVRMGGMAQFSVSAVPPSAPESEPESPEFPGCRPVRISREAIADYEGRIEYWDATTEVAMVCEPVSVYHEQPPQRLSGLVKTDRPRCAARRSRPSVQPTSCCATLTERWRRVLEADQTVYLHPRTTRPEGARIEVGSDTLPDVVLEVDSKILTCHWVPPCFNK